MSGGGKSKKKFTEISKILDNNNVDYHYKVTNSFEDAYTFSAAANKENYDVIAAVGGDGTINKVLNGFFDFDGHRISSSKMGIIHTGTSPDFCKSYNIPVEPEKAIEVILKNKTVKVQVGKISLSKENNKEFHGKSIHELKNFETKYFGCCANIGLGATLARKANSGIRKYLGDYLGTFISLVQTIINYNANNFIIARNGKKEEIEKLYNISVGRTKHIASGIKINNNLKEDDKRFYNLVVRNLSFINLPDVLKKAYSGKNFINNNVIYLEYSKDIEIYGNYNNPEVEFDGDPAGFLPCKIEIADDTLDLLVKST
jgi:diacylglycerol kinase family enzyme